MVQSAGAAHVEIAKVILIGGAPMSGKTCLARKLAAEPEYCCFSTDDAVQAVRSVTTPGSHPGFHVMKGEDYREYYINRSLDELIADAERQHQASWPAIEELIRIHATWGEPAIIEGWGLQPELVSRLDIPSVQSLWLVVEEVVLERRIRNANSFHKGASNREKLIKQFLARAIWFNRHIKDKCSALGIPALHPSVDATVEDIAKMALEALRDQRH